MLSASVGQYSRGPTFALRGGDILERVIVDIRQRTLRRMVAADSVRIRARGQDGWVSLELRGCHQAVIGRVLHVAEQVQDGKL